MYFDDYMDDFDFAAYVHDQDSFWPMDDWDDDYDDDDEPNWEDL